MISMNYKNKVCVVTGASSGIGLSTVKLLVEEGAIVYALDRNLLKNDSIHFIECDLCKRESIDLAFHQIPEEIDCFFGVAGLSGALTDYYTTFTVNYIANKYITEEYLKLRMKDHGAICYVTSVAGEYWSKYSSEFRDFTKAMSWDEMMSVLHQRAEKDTVGVMAYPLSKRALNYYMAEVSLLFGRRGVRVNALLPASTETGMMREFEVEAGGHDALISQTGIAERLAKPEEMAYPLLFLNSDLASFISGICLTVDFCNDAMIKVGKKHDRLDMKVGNRLFNLGFIQKMLRKKLQPLQDETKKSESTTPSDDEII